MAETMKPCPFCGGEAHIKEVVSSCETVYSVGCSDSECMGFETLLCKPTPEEAAAAWNRRAERTCRYVGDEISGGCSECRGWLDPACSYCPSCGARVMSKR